MEVYLCATRKCLMSCCHDVIVTIYVGYECGNNAHYWSECFLSLVLKPSNVVSKGSYTPIGDTGIPP
jgi:hypothetical protein